MQTLYLKHPCRWPVLGERAAFDCLTRQDVLDYHASRYVPNNVVLSIAGDVDAAEILSHLELLVEDLKSRRQPYPRAETQSFRPERESGVF